MKKPRLDAFLLRAQGSMIRWITHKLRIWRLDRSERRTRKEFQKERLKEPSSGAFKFLEEESFKTQMINDERSEELTSHLISQARRFNVPIPGWDNKNAWEESPAMGIRYLRPEAFAELRSLVRKERNELWQFWELRLKVLGILVTGSTGAIGALIGLIAIWRK